MKKTLQIALLASLSILTACCGSEQSIMEQSADKYLNAMANYDFQEAAKYATPETREVTLTFFEENVMPYLDSSYMEKNTPAKIRIKKITMTSDSTAVVYYHKTTPIKRVNDSLLIVRHGEEWQANQVIVIPGQGNGNGQCKTVKRKPNPFKAAKKAETDTIAQ